MAAKLVTGITLAIIAVVVYACCWMARDSEEENNG